MASRAWSKNGKANWSVYSRGAAVLHMLRVHLGDAAFDAAIRTWVADYGRTLTESEDLRRVLEDHSGVHLGWLFDQYVFGAGQPSLSSSHRYDESELIVTVEQKDDEPPFYVPVRVEVGAADGVTRHLLWSEPGRATLAVALEQAPAWVAVDPDGGVLADWSREQSEAEWLAQMADSPSAFARRVAIATLGGLQASDEVITSLGALVAAPSEPEPLRAAAAKALGELSTETAAAALVVERDTPTSVREAAARALGEIGAADAALGAIDDMLRDESPRVRAAALHSLRAHDETEAARLARTWLGRADPTRTGVLHQAALDVLREVAALADFDLALRKMRDRRRSVEVAGGQAAAAIVTEHAEGVGDEPRRRTLSRALLAWLDSADQRARERGLLMLAEVGDAASLSALDAYGHATTIGHHRELADQAIASIRGRGREVADDETATELEALREELEGLQERLDRLEEWR